MIVSVSVKASVLHRGRRSDSQVEGLATNVVDKLRYKH